MNREETVRILAAVAAVYPSFTKDRDTGILAQVWQQAHLLHLWHRQLRCGLLRRLVLPQPGLRFQHFPALQRRTQRWLGWVAVR